MPDAPLMRTVPAIDGDGRSALARIPCDTPFTRDAAPVSLVPGDVVRDGATWSAVAAIAHDGIAGTSTLGLLGPAGSPATRVMATTAGRIEALTEFRIDPATLGQLASPGAP